MSLENIKQNNFTFRINFSSGIPWSANIDNFEIAFDYTLPVASTPTPTITPTPTQTPTPTPTPPEPFLDLPWGYKEKGLSFVNAATAINSYFDHEYPLLSTGLAEPEGANKTVVRFDRPERTDDSYSSHDGYDYGTPAKVKFQDPVLAAASGLATLEKSSVGCGYKILIDHQNGYQTRYCHLYDKGYLVATDSAHPVFVTRGQKIGEVGFTGNVIPAGENGAHIHFMVVYDKNGDGNFEDNIPDGLVDPFGWQSSDPDPWENYTFNYLGKARTGSKSHYLWTTNLANVKTTISDTGKTVTADKYTLLFPSGSNAGEEFELKVMTIPIVGPLVSLGVLGAGIDVIATDLLGNLITTLSKPFTLIVDFAEIDLSRYDIDTIFIYSSLDGEIWTKETGTAVDLINKKATAKIDHLTQFALMAERRDSLPPLTAAVLRGKHMPDQTYNSGVWIDLIASDGAGLGVDYTVYSLDSGGWQEYTSQISVFEEGDHTITYYSVDNDGNVELAKTEEFTIKLIDDVPPEMKIVFDPMISDFVFIPYDASGSAVLKSISVDRDTEQLIASDAAGNTLNILLSGRDKKKNSTLTINSLQYNNDPPLPLDRNRLSVKYSLDHDGNFNKFEQLFEVKDNIKVKLVYAKTDNMTTVTTREMGKEKIIEEQSGMKILQLHTDHGRLEYSY